MTRQHRPEDQARHRSLSLEQSSGTCWLRSALTVQAKLTIRVLQICVLDEPSNFLDREALGGLAVAIRDWAGAVVRDIT